MKRYTKGFLHHEPDDEEQQEVALERCEAALSNGLRQQFVAGALVGAQLSKIRDKELYRAAGCKTLGRYCSRYLEMTPDLVRRYLDLHEVLSLLRTANLEPPMSEAQARMLARIPRSRLASLWRAVVAHCVQHQIALSDCVVRQAVRFEIASRKQIVSSESDVEKPGGEKPREGVKVTLEY